ncbi:CoA ester lyase [Caballeronia sp. LZ065]|uniref:HpcH/HpaI aldolase/citrate lyase family protein n=1 Tax=Caballeronia sp. LZ065 TaxID=3038571 RepID=UPI0028584824|nr:CoA ester lyase [Caballeronia sp. LZ065]MDR5780640.1 CoA ester lyase [Caballeronia sp. LZ065]
MALSRTFLFVPGNHARRVEKALNADVDAAILDLEDAVAASEKVATRAAVVEALQAPHRARGYIRINALDTDYAFGDLHAVIARGVDGIVLPKLESVEQLHTADWIMSQLERERGLEADSIELMPIIETGAGFAAIQALCASAAQRVRRLKRFAFGAGDFCLDMNLIWSGDESELHAYRSALVLSSRAAGLQAPVDTVWVRLDDADGLARSAVRARGMGFQGKLCIHPAQCDAVNRAFSPTEAEITQARAVVEAFRRAEAEGVASIRLDGAFIDYPVAYRAQRVLDFAAQIDAR